MQIVIDISDETYNEIMDDAKNAPRNLSHYERIIANGTQLDKIRAEIEQQYKWLINTRYTIRDVGIAFNNIFWIIDKYKGESEE